MGLDPKAPEARQPDCHGRQRRIAPGNAAFKHLRLEPLSGIMLTNVQLTQSRHEIVIFGCQSDGAVGANIVDGIVFRRFNASFRFSACPGF
ncbi:MAG: hypothetical protein EBU34_13685 [Alphaproteobacteria bacterium]|nr:hypothetical protein [Alphaproteobacteria bacterium]